MEKSMNESNETNRKILFYAGCFAVITNAFSFSIEQVFYPN